MAPGTDMLWRDTWQARSLAAAEGKTAAVLLSVLAHNYEDSLMLICRAIGLSTFLPTPFLVSIGKVNHDGSVIAKVQQKDGEIEWWSLYPSELALRDDFRRLADRLKLSDADRVELFDAVKRWLPADRRLDPAMDPKDPDAKRLVH